MLGKITFNAVRNTYESIILQNSNEFQLNDSKRIKNNNLNDQPYRKIRSPRLATCSSHPHGLLGPMMDEQSS